MELLAVLARVGRGGCGNVLRVNGTLDIGCRQRVRAGRGWLLKGIPLEVYVESLAATGSIAELSALGRIVAL